MGGDHQQGKARRVDLEEEGLGDDRKEKQKVTKKEEHVGKI